MMTSAPFEFDVAISFASEDRVVAEEFADLFAQRGIRVFRDEYQVTDTQLRGNDVLDHLVNLFARKARYCLLLISRHYPLQSWTSSERESARERALRDPDEYILPILLETHEVPGLTQSKGYRDLRGHSVESLVSWLDEKLKEADVRGGHPPESHDLRSGNIPRQET